MGCRPRRMRGNPVAVVTPLLRAEDVERFPSDARGEFIDGVFIEMPPVTHRHGRVAANAAALLIFYVRPGRLGFVSTEVGFILRRTRTPFVRRTWRSSDPNGCGPAATPASWRWRPTWSSRSSLRATRRPRSRPRFESGSKLAGLGGLPGGSDRHGYPLAAGADRAESGRHTGRRRRAPRLLLPRVRPF